MTPSRETDVRRCFEVPRLLERLLNAGSAEPQYRVVNAARPGRSSGWVLASLDRWLQRYHPAVATIRRSGVLVT